MEVAVDNSMAWYHTWCEPIVIAMIEKDDAAIQRETHAAEAALESSELSNSDKAKLRCQLAYLNFQIVHTDRNHELIDLAIQRCENVLAFEEVDDVTEGLGNRLYLQYRIMLDGRKRRPLSLEELGVYYNRLPEEERNLEVYSLIANWAFRHRNVEYLELACDFAVFQGKAFCAQWIWKRSRAMLDLLKGRATKRDISQLIQSAKLPMQFEIIRNLIWPMVEQNGLDDHELRLQLADIEGKAKGNLKRLVELEVKPHCGQPDFSRASSVSFPKSNSSAVSS